MNLTDDEVLKFQKGSPVFFDDVCAIYPSTIGEIVDLGYSVFQQYLGMILAEKPVINQVQDESLKQLLTELTDFQYILMLTAIDLEANQLLKDAFKFFIHEDITISLDPAQIIIGDLNEKHLITEENFYDFQRVIKRMFFIEADEEEIIINPDDPPSVRNLKLQMRENRKKLQKAKAKQAEREKTDLKFSDLLGSLTINDCGLNIANIWDITYYAFHDQLKRMGWRDQFAINNQAALAGAKLNKKQLKHWMRSIASSDKS